MRTLGDVCDIAVGVGFGVLLPAGGEAEVAADHLQQPDIGGGVGDAAPAASGAVEHGEQQRQCGAFTGEPAGDLDPASGLTEGPLNMRLVWRIRGQCARG